MQNAVNTCVHQPQNAVSFFDNLPDELQRLVVEKLSDITQEINDKTLIRLSAVSKNMRDVVRDTGLLKNAQLRHEIHSDTYPTMHLCDGFFTHHDDPSVSAVSLKKVVGRIQDAQQPIAAVVLSLFRSYFFDNRAVCDAVQQRLDADINVVRSVQEPA